jgi:hypothetical protein
MAGSDAVATDGIIINVASSAKGGDQGIVLASTDLL